MADMLPPIDIPLNLLLLLESPHRDELNAGVPLCGEAGRLARNFLSPGDPRADSLGRLLIELYAEGRTGIGVMNVSPVPLQLAAYDGHCASSLVSGIPWDVLKDARSGDASRIDKLGDIAAQEASRLLLPSLTQRLSRVKFAQGATVAPAGKFAQRIWRSLATRPSLKELPVPHPSNGWWTRDCISKQDKYNLSELKQLFEALAA